jgi:hypothetical protein
MDSLTGLLVTVIIFLTVAVAMIVIWQVLLTFKPKIEKKKEAHLGEFKSRIILLSNKELEAYELLRGMVKNRNLLLLSKIRLLDLVQPLGDREARSDSFDLLNNVLVDLVICDKTSGKIILAVELLDSKAEKSTVKLLSEVLAKANIPLIEFDTKFKIEEIRGSIELYLNK